MAIRGCRIAVSLIAVIALFLAIALTISAATIPQWQVAVLDQVSQIRYIGLYQSCTYGSRQGPEGWPQWICVFIPYGQENLQHHYHFGNGQWQVMENYGSNEVDYTARGGETWRLATLILLMMAAFFGFLSFVFEMAEICLDATRTLTCLKAMSGLSLATLALATLCCICGIATFAIESQESENLYIMELTAFAIFQWGQSFYLGIAALVMFFIALGIDIGGTVLVCATAKQEHQTYQQQLFFVDDRGGAKGAKNREGTKNREGDAAAAEPMIQRPSSKQGTVVEINRRQQPRVNFANEPTVWKFPQMGAKMTRV